jgi:rhamnosyltransferase
MNEPGTAALKVDAIVVAFAPDAQQFNRLLAVLALECHRIYVMDNGGGREAVIMTPQTATVSIVDMAGNQGIGAALNRGFEMAAEAGSDFVTTFDQDSEPSPGQVAALIDAFERLRAAGVNVAAVGPRTVDIREAKGFDHSFVRRRMGWPVAVNRGNGTAHIEVDFLITSGSVISMAAFHGVGPYDPALFVDYTDVDWCLRALARGYRLFGICSVTMPHELSSGPAATALGMRVLSYRPVRRYYYARNVLRLCGRSYVPQGWKARLVAGLVGRLFLLPVAVRFSRGWTLHWRMLVRGISDGIRNRGGAYPDPQAP